MTIAARATLSQARRAPSAAPVTTRRPDVKAFGRIPVNNSGPMVRPKRELKRIKRGFLIKDASVKLFDGIDGVADGPLGNGSAWSSDANIGISQQPPNESGLPASMFIDFTGDGSGKATATINPPVDLSSASNLTIDYNGLGLEKEYTVTIGGKSATFKTIGSFFEAASLWEDATLPLSAFGDTKKVDKIEIASKGQGNFHLEVRGIGAS